MNKTGIVIILLCFLAAAAVVLWERRKTRKTMEEIERMLDAAMTGSFSETNFDESQLSALETKFAHYLSAAEASSQNIAQEKDKIKTLIADISHQTKTPIANLLLYSELLMEETLPASAKANVEALYKQSEKLHFLTTSSSDEKNNFSDDPPHIPLPILLSFHRFFHYSDIPSNHLPHQYTFSIYKSYSHIPTKFLLHTCLL